MTPIARRHLRLCALLAVLGSSLAPALARANSASAPADPNPVRDVRAGDTVELRWPGLPRGAREVEVLLSVDGGARFSLRASAEVDAARGRVLWHVPALPTAHARLRLRWGDGRSENLAPPTPEFRILPARVAGGTTLAPWDEDDAATAGPTHADPADVRADGATLCAGDDAIAGVTGSDASPCAPPRSRGAITLPFRTARPPALPAAGDATHARSTPRRE